MGREGGVMSLADCERAEGWKVWYDGGTTVVLEGESASGARIFYDADGARVYTPHMNCLLEVKGVLARNVVLSMTPGELEGLLRERGLM